MKKIKQTQISDYLGKEDKRLYSPKFEKFIGNLNKEQLLKKNICQECNLTICNNNYENCIFLGSMEEIEKNL